jgi:hypothetical protein
MTICPHTQGIEQGVFDERIDFGLGTPHLPNLAPCDLFLFPVMNYLKRSYFEPERDSEGYDG